MNVPITGLVRPVDSVHVVPLIVVAALTAVVGWTLIASGRARGSSRPELLLRHTPQAHGRGTAYLVTCAHEPTIRPVSLDLTCGNGPDALDHLSWTSWGGSTASAEGRYVEATCGPDCGRTSKISYRVAVTAADPIRISGISGYRKIVIRWTGLHPSWSTHQAEAFDFVANGAIRGPGAS